MISAAVLALIWGMMGMHMMIEARLSPMVSFPVIAIGALGIGWFCSEMGLP